MRGARPTMLLAALAASTLGGTACESAPPPPEPVRRDAGPRVDAFLDVCVRATSTPIVEVVPNDVVDVIVVVDNSGSMREEAAEVRDGLNAFAETLGASGLDYHVIVLSRIDTLGTGVCVAPPLGTGAPDCGSGPEGRLRQVPVTVSSTDGPTLALDAYPLYRDFLRDGSVRAFLWVTDDDSELSADTFRRLLDAREPETGFGTTIHHAIVGYYGDEGPSTWSVRDASCPTLARVGSVYLRLARCYDDANRDLTNCTPGAIGRVCQSDWGGLFEEIAQRTEVVAIEEPASCTLTPPAAPEGRTLDYSRLSVTYRSGETSEVLRRAASSARCLDWSFDDDERPTAIVLCPDVCRRVQRDPEAQLEVDVACYEDPG